MVQYADLPDWVKDYINHLKQQNDNLRVINGQLNTRINLLEERVRFLDCHVRDTTKVLYLMWLNKDRAINIDYRLWNMIPDNVFTAIDKSSDNISVSIVDLDKRSHAPKVEPETEVKTEEDTVVANPETNLDILPPQHITGKTDAV